VRISQRVGIMKYLLRSLYLIAAVSVACYGVSVWAMSGGSEKELLLQSWLSSHPHPSADVGAFKALSVEYRHLVVAKLSAEEYAALWQAVLLDARKGGRLPQSLYERASAVAVPATFTKKDAETGALLRSLETDARRELGNGVVNEIFITMGPLNGSKPAGSASIALRQFIRNRLAVTASAWPDCECCSSCAFTCSGGSCVSYGCNWDPSMGGCGFLGWYTCDGICLRGD
jgi:hypothetical protein